MEKQLTKEIERKARKLANTVAASSGYPTYGFECKNIILKACRKSIIDGFPLQDYFLGEIPMGDKSGVLAFFENIAEYGMGEDYNPNAHEIIFWCPYNSQIAIPHAMCNDGIGDYNEERENCFEAVYRLEYPQKGRRIIPKIRSRIYFELLRIKRLFRNMRHKPSVKILAIADLHAWDRSELELIKNLEFDCCCLLGDIPQAAIDEIRQLVHRQFKPIFGVLGNHDDQGALERCGIYNLDRKGTVINGVSIAGIGGSHRYKNGDYPMLTQKESIDIAEHCPKADILISHDAAFHVMKRLDKAHCGLKGISKYISRNKPKLNICGHYHENIRRKYKGCEIICVYRCALVSYPSNIMDVIF